MPAGKCRGSVGMTLLIILTNRVDTLEYLGLVFSIEILYINFKAIQKLKHLSRLTMVTLHRRL